MFGPLLGRRAAYPALHRSAEAAIELLEHSGACAGNESERRRSLATAACGAVHGLAWLAVMNVLPATEARTLTRQVLEDAKAHIAKTPAVIH